MQYIWPSSTPLTTGKKGGSYSQTSNLVEILTADRTLLQAFKGLMVVFGDG